MATAPDSRTLDAGTIEEMSDEGELEELEKLEADVEEMAAKALHYRKTLPDQLSNTFITVFSAQRPFLPFPESPSEAGPPDNPNTDGVPGKQTAPSEGDEQTAEKIRLLQQRISSNLSAMSVVLNKLKQCMGRIEKLESSNGNVHPAFKRIITRTGG